jgi:hypothetical protein
VSDALVAEIAALDPNAPVGAYRVSFDYAIFSRKPVSSLYPANTLLLRKGTIAAASITSSPVRVAMSSTCSTISTSK